MKPHAIKSRDGILSMSSFALADAYKFGHPFQYPPGTTGVYANLTPRSSRIPGATGVVWFGLQAFCQEILQDHFDRNFFGVPKDKALADYARLCKLTLGGLPSYDHIAAVHDLGHLPLRIKALPEGTFVPYKVPVATIRATRPEAFWLTNWVETIMNTYVWPMSTSATTAHEFRKMLDKWAAITGMPSAFVQWGGHDFSLRGMFGPEAGVRSGMAHLLSFTGTDTLASVLALEQYYGANAETELIGGSVAATEHGVMCAGGSKPEEERATIRRLLVDVCPTGILSVVSDTWDLWRVLTEHLPALKPIIMAREGKLVIRPDSGDPANILCGDPNGNTEAKRKGVVELLWDVFGGTITSTGYRLLDEHVGVIYGDGIYLARGSEICQRLAAKGFASQCVFGLGSYTYQYVTRDTHGFATKATYVNVNGKGRSIYKDPVTDDGGKKSARGLLRAERDAEGKLILLEDVTEEQEAGGLLETVFENGALTRFQTLAEIRALLAAERAK